MTRAVAVAVVGLGLLGGCGQNMQDQPKYDQYEPAGLFENGRVLQLPRAGTIGRGDLDRQAEAVNKPALTRDLLTRGRTQHDVFCAPCHARTGDGLGMIVKRGMRQPPSYHDDRLRNASDQHFYDVISNGFGAMYAYASRIGRRDRWAIIAYIRALQLSQHARVEDLSEAERAKLLNERSP
jgi:mono/diheme cytochrome c family protein